MENFFALEPFKMHNKKLLQTLLDSNKLTLKFGLSLSNAQIQTLMEHRTKALKNTNRVEFGEGILKKLIYEFCDSPYITQLNYLNTLIELQEIFYYFKNESMEKLSDDELIESMKTIFDGVGGGSLEYLGGTSLEKLCRTLRIGVIEENDLNELEDEEESYE